ncbi:NlpC/P60 family protein [Roseibium alexandrii]|uniref:Putative peptidoglycan binding domain protein n=1 Tax=Roseibium alexandrii (strain DSM 17067 / NCIMB 14079 / DFL-11) TaxID=244592 RepID=A0A5E8H177_ROSAD|nr:peptidoglycan-binding protein [Roseibium alexandrii]EEE46168.2 putative peptidoglycan binding domain protein [Roseibium alexandrii DFL-11]
MTFETWLQMRLNVHGAQITEDGVIGNETTAALKAFQIARHIKPTGIADAATVKALRISSDQRRRVPTRDVPTQTMPPWLLEMNRRMGLHEGRDNRALSAWLRFGSFLGDPAKLPWCGDAVETAIVKTLPDEPVPSNPFWAQAWKTFGIDAGGPLVASIGVIRWSPRAGHVGIVVGYDAKRRRVHLMGGNQQNAVTISSFPEDKFIAYRWPKTFPFRQYPALRAGSVAPADFAATR